MKCITNSLFLGALAVLVTGCADPTLALEAPPGKPADKTKPYIPTAMAGVNKDVTKSMDPARLKGLVASTARYGHRDNPFALGKDEMKFDTYQAAEKLLAEQGNFSASFELPEDKLATAPVEEQQPYRRISGIIIGDAVYAILEQGGTSTIIRPGSTIPGTDWVVVSIDKDRVVLRRPGNVLPNEIEVRLELPPPGFGNTSGSGNGGRGPIGGPAGVSGAGGGGGAAGASSN